jgi:hypothetical protein
VLLTDHFQTTFSKLVTGAEFSLVNPAKLSGKGYQNSGTLSITQMSIIRAEVAPPEPAKAAETPKPAEAPAKTETPIPQTAIAPKPTATTVEPPRQEPAKQAPPVTFLTYFPPSFLNAELLSFQLFLILIANPQAPAARVESRKDGYVRKVGSLLGDLTAEQRSAGSAQGSAQN